MLSASTHPEASNALARMATNWASPAEIALVIQKNWKDYETQLNTWVLKCLDVDECRDRPGICNNGECNNFQGSFQCVCRNGYTLTPSRDSCVDIDECQRNPNICNNGTCINALGSYKCHCYAGFKLSPNNDCAGQSISFQFQTISGT